MNPKTPLAVLDFLARSEVRAIRWRVALNDNVPPYILELLSTDPWVDIRKRVADHRNTPVNVLRCLAEDEDASVARSVAQHKNTPPDVLAALSVHDHDTVRHAAALNRNTLPEALAEMIHTMLPERTVEALAGNPQMPPAALEELAKGKLQLLSIEARLNLIDNPNTSPAAKENLSTLIRKGRRTSDHRIGRH